MNAPSSITTGAFAPARAPADADAARQVHVRADLRTRSTVAQFTIVPEPTWAPMFT
jgi:hypothetical protein